MLLRRLDGRVGLASGPPAARRGRTALRRFRLCRVGGGQRRPGRGSGRGHQDMPDVALVLLSRVRPRPGLPAGARTGAGHRPATVDAARVAALLRVDSLRRRRAAGPDLATGRPQGHDSHRGVPAPAAARTADGRESDGQPVHTANRGRGDERCHSDCHSVVSPDWGRWVNGLVGVGGA